MQDEQTLNQRMKGTTARYDNLGQLFVDLAGSFQPPERLTVAQAAARHRRVHNPGAYSGPWRNEDVPYMVEPMEMLTDRSIREVIFCGPAQSTKTDALIVNFILYTFLIDPMDMIVYNPTNSMARDFSIRRIDRLHDHNPALKRKLLSAPDADNKFDKLYRSGVMLSLSWPSVSELAGRPIGRVALTDYDRMPDDIDGEGPAFDLARKRTTTFGSFAKTVVESSPSRPVENPRWVRGTEHQAPPTKGILGLYNRGDRRRWYWPCAICHEFFEATFKMLRWEPSQSFADSGQSATLECPHCTGAIQQSSRYAMQQEGHWLRDGQRIDRNGIIEGNGTTSQTASFWLRGPAAAFTSWANLVETYLTVNQEFQNTGNESSLVKFYNNDLAEPYLPKAMDSVRLPEALMARSEPWEPGTVPPDVRFLIAAIDVQTNVFVVQVVGFAPGQPADIFVIDRFQIDKSTRVDESGDFYMPRPATILEDWMLITEKVIERTYPLSDNSGRRMAIKLTVCDSGGRAGVTTNAYDYWRHLAGAGMAGRFHLVKGHSSPNAQRTNIIYPDSQRKDRHANARREVPVLLLQSNLLKDAVSGRLDSITPGAGMIHWNDNMPKEFFSELCSEIRTDKGWDNPRRYRNESWDLLYYAVGAAISPLVRIEVLNWDRPPSWAAPWDQNPMVIEAESDTPFANPPRVKYDWEALGRELA
jgi:phage terminase large subunit GpA-like protein